VPGIQLPCPYFTFSSVTKKKSLATPVAVVIKHFSAVIFKFPNKLERLFLASFSSLV
jgi:hypothetical protein